MTEIIRESTNLTQEALAPAEPRALARSIAELDAWEHARDALCEIENEVSFSESVALCLHELKRLRAAPPTSGDSSVERLREVVFEARTALYCKRCRGTGTVMRGYDPDECPDCHGQPSPIVAKIDAALAALSPAVSSGVGEMSVCTCQRYPTHQGNDCPSHGLADESYTAGEPNHHSPGSGDGLREAELFVIRRNGAFFRPNAAGYTNHVIAAGFYTAEEANSYRDVEGVTIEPLAQYRADAERAIAAASKLIAALQRAEP